MWHSVALQVMSWALLVCAWNKQNQGFDLKVSSHSFTQVYHLCNAFSQQNVCNVAKLVEAFACTAFAWRLQRENSLTLSLQFKEHGSPWTPRMWWFTSEEIGKLYERERAVYMSLSLHAAWIKNLSHVQSANQQLLKPTPKILFFLTLADVVQHMEYGDNTDSYIFISTRVTIGCTDLSLLASLTHLFLKAQTKLLIG